MKFPHTNKPVTLKEAERALKAHLVYTERKIDRESELYTAVAQVNPGDTVSVGYTYFY